MERKEMFTWFFHLKDGLGLELKLAHKVKCY